MAESNATQVILTDDGIKIIKAQNTADNAAGGVTNLNDPNLMSVIEKQTKASQYAGLTSQYNVILARAKDASISTTALTTAYTNLNTFMTAILTDTTKASDVNRDTYKSLTDAYNTALSNVQTALSNSFNTDIDNMQSSVSVASQAASSAVIVASQATTTGNNASQVASQAIVVASQAQSAGNNATSIANSASQAASSAVLAGSQATVSANKAITAASQAQSAGNNATSIANNASQAASSAILVGSQAAVSANKASADYQTLSAGVKDGSVVHITTETVIDKGIIGTAEIANGAITNAQIGNEAVNSAKIADLAVGTAQIGDGAITNAKIGKLAVGTAQIANGAITNAQIGSEAVGTAQIKDAAINSAKIANLAVGTAQIGDGAITNAKIGKLAVGTAQIANAAITDAQVGNVSANKLTAGTIDFNTITGKNINASNITTGKLSTDRLDVDKLSAVSADLGNVTTGSLKGVDIIANSFSTPNGSFTTDANGAVVASNLTIRGVTNLVYNAALLGSSWTAVPGWSLTNNGYCGLNVTHDGVKSIGFNNATGAGVWNLFAQTKLCPLNGVNGQSFNQPFSASVWFLDMGSDTSLMYSFTLAFFDSNGNRIDGGFITNAWNGIGSRQGWRYVTIDNAVAPSNATYVGLQYWSYNGHGNAYFSSPMLTQTAKSTGYQPDTGNVISAGEIDSSVINSSTINTPTLNLGTNGTLTTDFDINQDTGLYAPKKGTGTLTIKTGVISSSSDNMSRYSNTEGYWYGFDDNGSMVKNGTNHTGDDYAPGYVKHDIMKSNGNVLNRSYMDAMGLMFNEGGTQTFNTLLTAVGLDTGSALLHKDLATNGTFEAALGANGTYGFTIGSKVIAPMVYANQVTYSANMFISRNGYMAVSTSTKANKLDIVDVPDMLQKGYNLLTINPRQWFDKTSVEAYADVKSGNSDSIESVVDIKPVTGMVAEEVASAGLDDYVIKDENNKVQGLAYDRLWTLLLPVLRDMNNRLNEAQLEITKLKRGCLK